MKPSNSTRDQLMVLAAFRYCLGRMTYIVSDCVNWLESIVYHMSENTKCVIVRDIIEAIIDGRAGSTYDVEAWKRLCFVLYNNIKDKHVVADSIRWKLNNNLSDETITYINVLFDDDNFVESCRSCQKRG